MVKCSGAGCNQQAVAKVIWRNPKIHFGDKTKTWLACPEHLEYLVDYLNTRGFYLRTEDH